jgi:hypothetical protein
LPAHQGPETVAWLSPQNSRGGHRRVTGVGAQTSWGWQGDAAPPPQAAGSLGLTTLE